MDGAEPAVVQQAGGAAHSSVLDVELGGAGGGVWVPSGPDLGLVGRGCSALGRTTGGARMQRLVEPEVLAIRSTLSKVLLAGGGRWRLWARWWVAVGR